jgi:uncharacterized protein involved in high-affinity Fe2+ transport
MLLALGSALIMSSCAGDGELDDSSTGGDTSSVNHLPENFSEVLLIEEEIADGAVLAVIEVAPPDQIETTSQPSLPKADAQLHVEAQLRYTGQMLGGHVEGEFVPYLMVQLTIVNDTTGERLDTRLRPHVGVAEGWHYAANLMLPGDSPTYSTTVTIEGPLPFDDMTPEGSVDGTIVTRRHRPCAGRRRRGPARRRAHREPGSGNRTRRVRSDPGPSHRARSHGRDRHTQRPDRRPM